MMAQDKEYTISDLTPKQQTLLKALIEGKSKADAYREAYPNMKTQNPTREADNMINNVGDRFRKFSEVYARARAEADRKAEEELAHSIIKRNELLAMFTTIFLDKEVSVRDRLKAGELLGKHLGVFEERLNVNMNTNPFADLTTDELKKLAGES